MEEGRKGTTIRHRLNMAQAGVHGILSTQLGGAEQQPNVEEPQVAPVQLTVWSLEVNSRVVVT